GSDPAREIASRGVAADAVVGHDLLLNAVELVFLEVLGVAEAIEGDGYVTVALNLGLDGVGVVLTGLADKPGPLGAEELPPGPLGHLHFGRKLRGPHQAVARPRFMR